MTTELQSQIQSSVDAVVSNTHEADWSEDFLSRLLIMRIREALQAYGSEDQQSDSSHSFDLQAYKLTGNAEESHGDIAFIVTRHTQLGPITGVGFYEAKASIDGYQYPAFKQQQLRRLCTSTPRLSYLFYCKKAGRADSSDWPTIGDSDSSPCFNVRTVDANYLRQVKDPNAALREYGLSFGYHFVQRILSGRELDYSRTPEQTVKNWLKVTRRSSALVVNIAIQDSSLPPIQMRQQYIEIEGFTFGAITPIDCPRIS